MQFKILCVENPFENLSFNDFKSFSFTPHIHMSFHHLLLIIWAGPTCNFYLKILKISSIVASRHHQYFVISAVERFSSTTLRQAFVAASEKNLFCFTTWRQGLIVASDNFGNRPPTLRLVVRSGASITFCPTLRLVVKSGTIKTSAAIPRQRSDQVDPQHGGPLNQVAAAFTKGLHLTSY